jgi:serine protease Do
MNYNYKVFFKSQAISVLLGCAFLLSGCSNLKTSSPQQNLPQPNQGTTTSIDYTSAILAASKVTPTVVGITTTKIDKSLLNQNQKVQGVGSGVIVNEKGYILTNNHVAGGAETLVVSLYDGRNVQGKTVWADPVLDLAIVKIDTDRLSVATLGDSKNIIVGQEAIAIGNPLGLTFQRTVTAGIISAVNRTIEVESGTYMEDLIQTDASINPGNSGGPLINSKGEVVGINTIKVVTAEGLGFAVPVNVVKPVIAKVASGANYGAPNIGLQSFDKELGKVFGFTSTEGVYVYDSKDGGCAHTAGIRKGDSILAVDGKVINSALEFKEALNEAGEGKTVKMRVKNGLGIKDVFITLDGMNKK